MSFDPNLEAKHVQTKDNASSAPAGFERDTPFVNFVASDFFQQSIAADLSIATSQDHKQTDLTLKTTDGHEGTGISALGIDDTNIKGGRLWFNAWKDLESKENKTVTVATPRSVTTIFTIDGTSAPVGLFVGNGVSQTAPAQGTFTWKKK